VRRPHAIQPFYTGLLARACGLGVGLKSEADTIVVATRDARASPRLFDAHTAFFRHPEALARPFLAGRASKGDAPAVLSKENRSSWPSSFEARSLDGAS